MNYYEADRQLLEAQEQYRVACEYLTKLICDPGATGYGVQVARAVVDKMELNVLKLTRAFNEKY